MPELPLIDDAHHAAATPLGPRICSVGTAEFAGANDRLDRERLNNLTAFIKAIYWQIAPPETLATGSVWAGLRPIAAEGCPYIGPTGTPGLWINSGEGHL